MVLSSGMPATVRLGLLEGKTYKTAKCLSWSNIDERTSVLDQLREHVDEMSEHVDATVSVALGDAGYATKTAMRWVAVGSRTEAPPAPIVAPLPPPGANVVSVLPPVTVADLDSLPPEYRLTLQVFSGQLRRADERADRLDAMVLGVFELVPKIVERTVASATAMLEAKASIGSNENEVAATIAKIDATKEVITTLAPSVFPAFRRSPKGAKKALPAASEKPAASEAASGEAPASTPSPASAPLDILGLLGELGPEDREALCSWVGKLESLEGFMDQVMAALGAQDLVLSAAALMALRKAANIKKR
jgi:hypothetical protein